MNVAAGASFSATADLGVTGLAGTCAVRVIGKGTTPVARTTSGISEFPSGSGIYQVTLTAPSAQVAWILWDIGTTVPGNMALEDLTVT